MRRIVGVFAFLGLLLLLTTNAQAQDKFYIAERFEVDVAVRENGDLDITETILFRFEGEPFTFVFRDLLAEKTDGIENIVAYFNGRQLPLGDEAGEVEIDGNDDKNIVWHFEPLLGTHEFKLEYRLLGVMTRTDGVDLLRYQPLPDEFEYEMEQMVTTFTYPSSLDLVAEPTVIEGDAITFNEVNEVRFQWNGVEADHTLVVDLRFPEGSLLSSAPEWQQRVEQQNSYGPFWLVGMGLLSVFGLVGVNGFYRRNRPNLPPKLNSPIYSPPSDLAPALAGALNGSGPMWPNALAALFDLADRGVVRFEELPRGRFGQRDYELQLVDDAQKLRHHERTIVDTIFRPKGVPTNSVKFSKLSRRLQSKSWTKIKEAIEDDMKSAELWSDDIKPAKNRMIAIGIFTFLGAVVILVMTIVLFEEFFGIWPLLIALALMVIGLVAFTFTAQMRPLTLKGAEQAGEWQRFYEYMKEIVSNKGVKKDPFAFEEYLPYATSYGLLTRWAKYFDKHESAEVPAWFVLQPNTDASAGMGSFGYMAGMASSSGGSAGGGAGGGAAGGGGSGAG